MRIKAHLKPFTDTPNGHLNRWVQIVNRLDIPSETDVVENTIMLNRPYNMNIISLTNDTKKYIRHSEYKAYTDGSRIDSKTGAGVIIFKLNEIIYRQLFVNRNKKRHPAKYIKILVDSQAPQKALSGNSIKSETVSRTIQELSTQGFDIPRLTLACIKAHIDYESNELVDHAAKQGAFEPHMSIKTDIPISKTEIANTLKEQIYNK